MYRYIETGERCVTESLRLLCSVYAACLSEKPHGTPIITPINNNNQKIISNNNSYSSGIRQRGTLSIIGIKIYPLNNITNVCPLDGPTMAVKEAKLTDKSTIESGIIFPIADIPVVLERSFNLFQSCSKVCIECQDNIPMQSGNLV